MCLEATNLCGPYCSCNLLIPANKFEPALKDVICSCYVKGLRCRSHVVVVVVVDDDDDVVVIVAVVFGLLRSVFCPFLCFARFCVLPVSVETGKSGF